MTTTDSKSRWDEGIDAETDTDRLEETAAISTLSKRWHQEYADAAKQRQKELLDGAPGALPDEKLLLELSAKDAAIADGLWKSCAQLTARIGAFIDSPKTILLLVKALREVTGCRNATARRIEEALLGANTLRTQRRLANIASIRRVA